MIRLTVTEFAIIFGNVFCLKAAAERIFGSFEINLRQVPFNFSHFQLASASFEQNIQELTHKKEKTTASAAWFDEFNYSSAAIASAFVR